MHYDIDSITLPVVVRFAMKDGKIRDIEVVWEEFTKLPDSGWKDIFNDEIDSLPQLSIRGRKYTGRNYSGMRRSAEMWEVVAERR